MASTVLSISVSLASTLIVMGVSSLVETESTIARGASLTPVTVITNSAWLLLPAASVTV